MYLFTSQFEQDRVLLYLSSKQGFCISLDDLWTMASLNKQQVDTFLIGICFVLGTQKARIFRLCFFFFLF